ncbi:MAG: autotransporter outer membrane beta-barrel domain-containing protein, partial [Thermoguttaceae bacterium]|nr:autotransporter outer membrane beta-barrel domain-containing protein [Thermoguttaceae bacterium]
LVVSDAIRANDAFPSASPSASNRPSSASPLENLFFPTLSRRPALFCELAGIDVPPAETPRFADFSQFPQLVETAFSFSFAENAASERIERGAYLSNLPIVPFRGRFFAYADASWGSQDEQNESPYASGFKVASFGGGVGQDWRLTKNAIWGYGFQGRNIQITPDAAIYESEIDSFAGFLHMSMFGPLWRLDLSIGAGKSWNAQSSVFDVLKYSSTQWNYEAEFGVRFDKGYTRVEPLVNFRVMTLQEPSDAERRLVLLGRPSDYSDASYRLKLGSRFSWEYATRLATLKPFLTATWNHEFGDRALYVGGENTPFPILYRYAKHRMARDRLDLGGGVDAALRDTVDVFFRYDVEFAKEYANYLFYAGFHKKF